jgi:uncharacterized protein YjbJ (UPF0337 family)
MTGTGSRSGYDSTAEKAQGQTKKITGKLTDDTDKEREGAAQEARADAAEDEILEHWQRDKAVREMKDNPGR